MSQEREVLPHRALYIKTFPPNLVRGKWQIRVKRVKGQREAKMMTVYGYESKEVALEQTLLYQFALGRDHAKDWVGPLDTSIRLVLGNAIRNVSYVDGYSTFNAITEDASERRKRDCPKTKDRR